MTEVSKQHPGLFVKAAGGTGKGSQSNMSCLVTGVVSNGHRSLNPNQERAFRNFFDNQSAQRPEFKERQAQVLAEFSQNKRGDFPQQTGEAAERTMQNHARLLSSIAGFEKAMRDGAPTV